MKLRNSQSRREPRPKAVEVAAAIEPPHTNELRFNPQQELSDDIVSGLAFDISKSRALIGATNNYVYIAEALCVALPKERARFGIKDGDYELLEAARDYWSSRNFCWSLAVAAAMAIVFPERRAELDLNDKLFDDIKSELSSARGEPEAYCNLMHHVVVLFPERMGDFDFADVPDEVIEEIDLERRTGDWECYCGIIYNLAVAFPVRRGELGFDEQVFQAIYRELQNSKENGYWQAVALYTGRLAALAADDIRVTTNGIELINKRDFQQEAALPDRRLT